MQLEVSAALQRAQYWSAAHRKQLAFSVAQALNASAGGSKFIPGSAGRSAIAGFSDAVAKQMDRPKPFVEKGVRIGQLANKKNPTAVVTAKDRGGNRRPYIAGNIKGGQRPPKAYEHAFAEASQGRVRAGSRFLPITGTKLKTDKYGNIGRAKLKTVQGYISDGKAFVGKPKGGNRLPGVWLRHNNNKRLTPLFLVDNIGTYKPFFKPHAPMMANVNRTFPMYLKRQLAINVAKNP